MGAGALVCEVRDSLTCFGVSGTAAVAIEDFKIALAKTPINTDKSYVGVKIDVRSARLLSAKTINNCLTML